MRPYTKQVWNAGYTETSWREHQIFTRWARIIAIVAIALFALPLLSHADTRHHHSPPTALVTPTTSTGGSGGTVMCYNEGDEPLPYNWAQIDSDAAMIKAAGCTSVRIADSGWNNPIIEALALRDKADGLSPIVGGDLPWNTFTPSDEASYTSQVVQQAKWAQVKGITELDMGNEVEAHLSGMTQAQWETYVNYTLTPAVRAVYTGKIGYTINSDYATGWDQSGIKFDVLGLNEYNSDYQSNYNVTEAAIKALGKSHVYVSEINCDIIHRTDCQTNSGLSKEVQSDAVQLLKLGIPVYFFTIRSGGDGTSPVWGVTQYPMTMKVLGLH